LKLGKKDLRDSFAAFEEDLQDRERTDHGEGRARDDLAEKTSSRQLGE
jgi:hypothetical protein